MSYSLLGGIVHLVIDIQHLCCHLHFGIECIFKVLSFFSCSMPNPGGRIGGLENGGAECGSQKPANFEMDLRWAFVIMNC